MVLQPLQKFVFLFFTFAGVIFSHPFARAQDESFDVQLKSSPRKVRALKRVPASQTPTSFWHEEETPNVRGFKPRAKLPEIDSEKMSLKTYKTLATKDVRDIQLVSPPHNSTLTPGVVKFQWLVMPSAIRKEKGRSLRPIEASDPKPKLKINLILEKINFPNIKHLIKTQNLEGYISCDPGTYRWRVVGAQGKVESRWRLFKVIELKSRGTASIPKVLPPKINAKTDPFEDISDDGDEADDEDIPSIPYVKTKREPLRPMSGN